MPRKQHVVRLRRDDRRFLTRLVRTGRPAVATLRRARILLLADASAEGPAHTDLQIAAMVGVSDRTVELGLVASIAPETIRKALTKGGSSPGAPSAS